MAEDRISTRTLVKVRNSGEGLKMKISLKLFNYEIFKQVHNDRLLVKFIVFNDCPLPPHLLWGGENLQKIYMIDFLKINIKIIV